MGKDQEAFTGVSSSWSSPSPSESEFSVSLAEAVSISFESPKFGFPVS